MAASNNAANFKLNIPVFLDFTFTIMGSKEIFEIHDKIANYKNDFDEAFPGIVNELVEKDENNPELSQAASWLRRVLDYNTFDGKKSRGMMVVGTVDFLRGGKPSKDEIKKATCLGWCVEILQAVFLVADDVMDRSEMRRGKPCWYKKCGLVAINDTYLMEQSIFKLIDNHFNEEPYIFQLYKIFHKIIYLTAMGQELDMLASDPPDNDFSLDTFTPEKYKSIVKYKTAYYSFYLPVSLGMYVVKESNPKVFKEAELVLMRLGEFFQIQDDYLDCYGDPAVMGKVGRDIEDGKCSWLVVQALERVTAEEKEILKENYGKDDDKSVRIVKNLYKKLDLETVYKEYEEESYNSIREYIASHTEHFPQGLFLFLANKIYKRQK